MAGFSRRRFFPKSAPAATATASGDVEEVELDLFDALSESADESSDHDQDASSELGIVSPQQRAAFGLEREPQFDLIARSYQREAIDAWKRHDGRGVVVLPTG